VIGIVVAGALSGLSVACDRERDGGGATQETGASASSASTSGAEPVFSFDGYGAIRIGMSKPEVLAASPVPLAVYGNHNCTWLYDKRVADVNGDPAQTVQITLDRDGMVTHIDAYTATDASTDRGVKLGSSLSDVLAVYPEPSKRTQTQAAEVLVVSGSANDMSFALDEAERVVGMAVGHRGYALGFETCSG
jgi:hypothetical protein